MQIIRLQFSDRTRRQKCGITGWDRCPLMLDGQITKNNQMHSSVGHFNICSRLVDGILRASDEPVNPDQME